MKKGMRIGISFVASVGLILLVIIGCSKKTDDSSTPPPAAFTVGQNYGGGIIFYVDATGQHGLIDSGKDENGRPSWGCDSTSVPGTDTAVGTGKSNTSKMLAVCPNSPAAFYCTTRLINGYNDWFLPSIGELSLLFRLQFIQWNNGHAYWSSSQSSAYAAWVLDDRGKKVEILKYAELPYRPIRAF